MEIFLKKEFNDFWDGPSIIYFDFTHERLHSELLVYDGYIYLLFLISVCCFTSVFSFYSPLIGWQKFYVKVINNPTMDQAISPLTTRAFKI